MTDDFNPAAPAGSIQPLSQPDVAIEPQPTPPPTDEEEVTTEKSGPSMEDLIDSPMGKTLGAVMPGAGLSTQLAPDIAEGVAGMIPGMDKILEQEQVQDSLTALKNPLMIGAAGNLDFMSDLVEWISGDRLQIPQLPEYDSGAAQTLRNLYSIIGPTWGLGAVTRVGGTAGLAQMSRAAQGSSKRAKAAAFLERMGKDRLFSATSRTGITFGSGIAVEWVNKLSEEGSNFTGMLRDAVPQDYKFLFPEWLATTANDGPDDRKRKSVLEGAYLSTLMDVCPQVVKYMKARQGLEDTLNIKLENDTAENYQRQLDKELAAERIRHQAYMDFDEAETGDEILDALESARQASDLAGLRRMEQLDELGKLADEMDPRMDEPMIGRNDDQFDNGELGTQSVDPDAVRRAVIDHNDISNNAGTRNGRISNMISEGARMKGMEAEELTRRTLVNLVKEELDEIGEIGYTRNLNGEKYDFTYKQVDEDGTKLSEYLIDPLADEPFLVGLLKEFTEIKNGITNLNDVGMNAVGKAIDFWTSEYFNMNAIKASSYLQTSMAGQAADFAEATRRFDQPGLIEHAKEQILDRLEFLSIEQAIGKKLRGQSLNFLNTWKRVWQLAKRDPKKYREYLQREAENLGVEAAANMKNTVAETKEYFSQIRALVQQEPGLLKTFMLTNELTNGNVHNMTQFVEYWKNNYGFLNKMIIDRNPNVSSVLLDGINSNIYNSILSGPDTANGAGLANAVMLLQKPLNSLVGNALTGNWGGIRRGWYAYSAVGESMMLGFRHAAKVFRKLSEDPGSVPYVMREDYAIRQGERVQLGEELAKFGESKGNFGARYFSDLHKNLEAYVVHPVLRAGTNAIGMFDGFSRAMIANSIARFKAYDEAVEFGDFSLESMRKARKQHYEEMKTADGYLTNPEVDFQTRELGMALDHPVVDGVNSILKAFPALQPFMRFSRTSVNVIGAAWNHSFLSAFAGDYREMVRFPGYKHTRNEIEEIFKKRGIPIDQNMMVKFKELQGEIAGRVYASSMIGAGLSYYVLTDRVRGDGHRDPAIQKVRDREGWVRRTVQSPLNGKWYSYDGLGPISDWLALMSTGADNFNVIGTAALEDFFDKATFVLAASMTKRSFMTSLEPFLNFLGGDFKDLERFAAQNINALGPGSGFRSDFGKFLSEGNKELNNTLEEGFMNRNRWTEGLDPDGGLPVQRSMIDGYVTGTSDNMFERLVNFLSPIKVTSDMSPERQFLIDIEFDVVPGLIKDSQGNEYTTPQRSQVQNKMGEQLIFRDAIRAAMKKAEERGYLDKLRRYRLPFAPRPGGGTKVLGYFSDELNAEEFQQVHMDLKRALENAKISAEQELDDAAALREERILRERDRERVKQGLLPLLENK